jgi:hypothetical protein
MNACPHADDAALYALSLLTDVDPFEAHLGTCLACQLQVADHRETLGLLPLSLPPIAPPPSLKSRVLAAVAADGRKMPRRWALPAWVAAAAAVCAILLGGYGLLKVQGLNQQIAQLQQSALQEQSVALKGTNTSPTASGRVLVSHDGDGTRITLQAEGLPALEPGQVYQLWLIKDGKRLNGGLFVVDATGKGGAANWLPGAVNFDTMGITREPDAYGTQPRGPKIMGSST